MFLATQEICAAAGLGGYEISNHARPGAESRHNLVYWRYGDYVGIGPGAHGRLTRRRRAAGRPRRSARRRPGSRPSRPAGAGMAARTAVAPAEQAVEMLLMGLRLARGHRPRRFAALNGAPLAGGPLDELTALGLVELRDGGCAPPMPAGRSSTPCCGGCSPESLQGARLTNPCRSLQDLKNGKSDSATFRPDPSPKQ